LGGGETRKWEENWGSENRNRGGLAGVVGAAQKFVALDGRDHADGTFVSGLGALHAAQTANANRSCESNFIRQGQKNLDGRTLFHVLGQEEVHATRPDIARL